jgi:hypothetical protein
MEPDRTMAAWRAPAALAGIPLLFAGAFGAWATGRMWWYGWRNGHHDIPGPFLAAALGAILAGGLLAYSAFRGSAPEFMRATWHDNESPVSAGLMSASASLGLGAFSLSWIFLSDPNAATIGFLHAWHVLAGWGGMAACLYAFMVRSMRPLAALGGLLSSLVPLFTLWLMNGGLASMLGGMH